MQRTTVGVDRIEINQFEVIDIDLVKMSDVQWDKRVKRSRNSPIQTESGKWMPIMEIHDNNRFLDLAIGLNNTAGSTYSVPYTNLVITLHNIFGCNLNNIPLSQYRKVLDDLVAYIYETYAVLLSFEEAQIKRMEINCTFPIEQPFNNYYRILRILMTQVPRKYKFKDLIPYEFVDNKEFWDG